MSNVSDLLAILGGEALGVRHVGGDPRREVSEVVIAGDHEELTAGALVLAPSGAGVVASAASRACAGVVLREQVVRDMPAAADGPAIVATPRELRWGQLYTLLSTALVHGAGDPTTTGIAEGDLFSLANAIAAALDAPLTIEDPQFRVLAYSTLEQPIDAARRDTILGRIPPSAWMARLEASGILSALRSGAEPLLRFEHEDIVTRAVVPVRAGQELLGALWVAMPREPDADTRRELVRAGELASVHLIAHRADEDARRRARGTLVRDILEGRRWLEARPPTGGVTLMAFRLDPGQPDFTGDPERLLSIASLYGQSLDSRTVTARLEQRIWIVVPALRDRPRERLLEAARSVVARSRKALGVELLGVVGALAGNRSEVAAARAETERALGLLAERMTEGPVAHVDDLRSRALIAHLVELTADEPALTRGPVAKLVEYDARRKARLVPSLRAYLDAHGDAARAAGACGVHVNTLRYRLQRALEIADISLDDPEERLAVELALRLRDRGD